MFSSTKNSLNKVFAGDEHRRPPIKKGPLIVDLQEEKEAEEADSSTGMWTVCPPHLANPALIGGEKLPDKFFVNLAHCNQLPPPAHDVDEDRAAQLMDASESFKIPMSVGDLQWAEDKEGRMVQKVDALVNTTFFRKRIEASDFYLHFTLNIILEAIAQRHGIRLDPTKQVQLKNKRYMGDPTPVRIRRQPRPTFASSSSSSNSSGVGCSKPTTITLNGSTGMTTNSSEDQPTNNQLSSSSLIHVVSGDCDGDRAVEQAEVDADGMPVLVKTDPVKPRNYKVQILRGQVADILIRVRDPTRDDELVSDVKRFTLKMNDDRVAVLLDRERTVTDFHLPYTIRPDEADACFDPATATLHIVCPVDWKQQQPVQNAAGTAAAEPPLLLK